MPKRIPFSGDGDALLDKMTKRVDPNTGEIYTATMESGQDEFGNTVDQTMTRFGRSGTAIFDWQTDAGLFVSPNGQLNTGELIRLVGGNFVGGQPILPHIWTSNFVGSGANTTADGELILSTGIVADSVSRLTTFRRARFITATYNLAHLAVSTPGWDNADVIRRWGVYDPTTTSLGTDGVYIENNAGVYTINRVKNGILEETIVEANFNGGNTLIKNDNIAVYEIYYNAGTIFILQNRKLIHRFSSLDSAAYGTPHLRAGAIVENINGNIVDNQLVTRGFAISRIGANSAIPEPFHITASGVNTIKNTPARLHRIIINDKGVGAAQVIVYNDVTNAGEIIAHIDTSDVVGQIEYNLELDNGLTIETVGGSVDITVVYD